MGLTARLAPPLLVLFVGLGATLFGVLATWRSQQATARLAFDRLVVNRTRLLERNLTLQRAVISTLGTWCEMTSDIERESFERLAAEMRHRHPGIHGLEWIPRVPHHLREAFEREAREATGLDDFQIREASGDRMVPARQRAEYYPVYFVVPLKGNERALGFDLGSNPTRLTALRSAAATGEVVATRHIELVQERDGAFGFLVVCPTYHEVGRKSLRGFVLGVFRVNDLVEDAISPDFCARQGVRVSVEEPAPHGQWKRIYPSEAPDRPLDDLVTSTINVSRLQWRVRFERSRPLAPSPLVWVLLLAGHLLSLLISLYLHAVLRRRHLIEQEVAERTLELRRSNEDLELFAYAASHDLQEPLRMVSSYLDLLERRCGDQLEPRGHEYIAIARDGAQRMQLLLRELLEYSRIGREEEVLERVDCDALLDSVLADLAPSHGDLTVERLQPLPTLEGHPVRLRQLMQNLIVNASTYRRGDRPRLTIGCERRGDMWRFRFEDDGIGIDPAHFDRIFQLFQRLHTREEYTGTGIGLTSAKRIVETAGGRIWVESEPGRGTTFFFTLPARRRARSSPTSAHPTANS